MTSALEPIIGRYLTLDLGGSQHRIYFEEAGAGIPLLCLHTGGADTRQYRHLMLDEAITSRFRVIAFDMPFHGKSTPPDGWHLEEYKLTLDSYTQAILAFQQRWNWIAPFCWVALLAGASCCIWRCLTRRPFAPWSGSPAPSRPRPGMTPNGCIGLM